MVVLQELHTFSAVPGGYQCLTCSAQMPDATVAANTVSIAATDDSPSLDADPNMGLNLAYKKAGLP